MRVCADETVPQSDWYSLNEDDTVVTVCLPANATTSCAWSYEISDPSLLTIVSAEYIPSEGSEPLLGAGGAYVSAFRDACKGSVSIQFVYARPFETDDDRIFRTLHRFVSEYNQLHVVPWYKLNGGSRGAHRSFEPHAGR